MERFIHRATFLGNVVINGETQGPQPILVDHFHWESVQTTLLKKVALWSNGIRPWLAYSSVFLSKLYCLILPIKCNK